MDDVNRKMYAELGELARSLESAVRKCRVVEVPVETTTAQLPKATEHLSDLARLTEDGTHRVMALAESIQDNRTEVLKVLDELRSAVGRAGPDAEARLARIKDLLGGDDKRLMDIMTALSFQDLVGQRINKIIAILDDVEHKLLEMVVVFGVKQDGEDEAEASGRAEEMLKQLEASKTTALKQDLVDDILAEFGFNGSGSAVIGTGHEARG